MKRIVPKIEQTTVDIKYVESKDDDGIVALKKGDRVYILVGLPPLELSDASLLWAFHPLCHDGTPVYQSTRIREVLTRATNEHEVFFFETEREFLEWALGDNDD